MLRNPELERLYISLKIYLENLVLHQDNNLEFICLSIFIIYLLDRVFKLQGEFEKSLLGIKPAG